MTRVLIADPDSASRKALALLLIRRLGVESVLEASDLPELLQMVSEDEPHLLLVDNSLPGWLDGEICAQFRNAHPAIKIALLSVDESDAVKACQCQAEFIHKAASMLDTVSRLAAVIASIKNPL